MHGVFGFTSGKVGGVRISVIPNHAWFHLEMFWGWLFWFTILFLQKKIFICVFIIIIVVIINKLINFFNWNCVWSAQTQSPVLFNSSVYESVSTHSVPHPVFLQTEPHFIHLIMDGSVRMSDLPWTWSLWKNWVRTLSGPDHRTPEPFVFICAEVHGCHTPSKPACCSHLSLYWFIPFQRCVTTTEVPAVISASWQGSF